MSLDVDAYLTHQLRAGTVPGVCVSEGGAVTFMASDKLSALVVGFTKRKLQALAISVLGVDKTLSELSADALSASGASTGRPTTLADLTLDVLDEVATFGSPTVVGRLMCTCRILAVAATPRHPDWAWLRTAVRGTSWDAACLVAARSGHLEAMRWAHAQGYGLHWMHCRNAASGGHLAVLQWLRAQTPACPWDAMACFNAAHAGKLDLLIWARSQTPPCPWDASICGASAERNHLEVL